MQYQIVYTQASSISSALSELESSVSKLCNSNWLPQGNICICAKENGFYIACQAMIKANE